MKQPGPMLDRVLELLRVGWSFARLQRSDLYGFAILVAKVAKIIEKRNLKKAYDRPSLQFISKYPNSSATQFLLSIISIENVGEIK